jgi:dTDP-4-amino-4,6-dideoxygalactose transaminase
MPYGEHVYHLYVVRSARRDELQAFLKERGIGTLVHYPVPIHLQPCFAHLGYRRGQFPRAEEAASRILSLPIFVGMTEEEAEHVARTIGELVKAGRSGGR